MTYNYADEYEAFPDLLGRTIVKITRDGDEELRFDTLEGFSYTMYHSQDCCESVTISEVIGDLNDLLGTPLLIAEEVTSENSTPEGVTPPEYPESYTWTFYKLATVKGHVTIRWLGESNGYYSESVNCRKAALA